MNEGWNTHWDDTPTPPVPFNKWKKDANLTFTERDMWVAALLGFLLGAVLIGVLASLVAPPSLPACPEDPQRVEETCLQASQTVACPGA